MTPKIPDQHWWFFKHYEPQDYDDLMLGAQQAGAKSRDDVVILSTVSGCFESGDRLVARLRIVSMAACFTAYWRQSADWWKSGAKQRELYMVQQD